MATGTGVTEPQDSLGIDRPSSLNRRMRTRRYGGVGRVTADGAPYPISQDSGLVSYSYSGIAVLVLVLDCLLSHGLGWLSLDQSSQHRDDPF